MTGCALCVVLTVCLTDPPSREPDDAPLNAVLAKCVRGDGVDYGAAKREQAALARYVASLATVQPARLNRQQRMALFINAYNAATLLLVLEHLDPNLGSIKDIPEHKRWKHRRWKIGGEIYSLDDIENKVLRPRFKDPRIHAAVNCASVGCPGLRGEAFGAERLEEQLDDQCRRLVNNTEHVRIEHGVLKLSAIFDWFADDFSANGGSVIGFVRRYSDEGLRSELDKLPTKPAIEYLDYDWSLNRAAGNEQQQ